MLWIKLIIKYCVSCWITDISQNDTRSIQYRTQKGDYSQYGFSLVHRQQKISNKEGGATHRSLEDADLFPEGLVLLPQFGDAVLELVDAGLQQEVTASRYKVISSNRAL